jgi:hypothetical protein
MNQVSLMFDSPVLALVNSIMLLGIVLAAVAISRLNRITERQHKRNLAMQKVNSRLK